jgi:hypothetical protein
MRRSTVLSIPLQLVFPGQNSLPCWVDEGKKPFYNIAGSCIAVPNLGLETLRILMAVLPAFDSSDLEAQAVMCCPNRYRQKLLTSD